MADWKLPLSGVVSEKSPWDSLCPGERKTGGALEISHTEERKILESTNKQRMSCAKGLRSRVLGTSLQHLPARSRRRRTNGFV